MKSKLLPFILAILLIAGMSAGLFFLLDFIMTDKNPVVGECSISTSNNTIVPVQNQIYVTTDKVKTNGKKLQLSDIAADLPEIEYNETLTGRFENGSKNGDFKFTIYDENLEVYVGERGFFSKLTEKGTYIIRTETYWGSPEYNVGMEYYYKVKLS